MGTSKPPPAEAPVFAAPSLEGASLALRELLREGRPEVEASAHCAVAIDVFSGRYPTDEGGGDVLIQRAIAHADVSKDARDALRELLDRHVSRFAEAQRLDGFAGRRGAQGYRDGGHLPSNDFAGFDCGHALASAKDRTARLRAGLKGAEDLDVRLYAVPFLVARIDRGRGRREEAVVMRREDGAYVYEVCGELG